jgi:O-antigen/teichoic acid export membrane protein
MPNNVGPAYGWQFAGRVIPQVLAFGISIAMVRIAGVNTVGMYAVAVAVVSICVGLFGVALDTDLLRRKEGNLAPLVVVAKLFLWVCALPIVVACLSILEIPLLGGIAIYVGLFFFHTAETAAVASRLANDDISSIAPRVLSPVVFLTATVLIGLSTFEQIAGFFLLSWLLAPLVAKIQWGNLRKSVSYRRITGALVAAKAIAGILFFTQLYGNADLIILNLIVGPTAAGEYRIAQAFAAVLMPVVGVLTFVYLSQARLAVDSNDVQRLRKLSRQQFVLHVGIGVLVVFAMTILLPWAIPFFYGHHAVPAVVPAIVLSGAAALNAIGMVFVYTLLAMNRDRLVVWAAAAAATVNVVLNISLVPLFSTTGAAWASVLSFLTMILVLAMMTSRAFREFKLIAGHV